MSDTAAEADTTAVFNAQVKKLQLNLPLWAERYVKIRPKAGGAPIPFIFNQGQWILHNELEKQRAECGLVRMVIVKGRQLGTSSYVAARFLHRATMNRGVSVFILAHMTKSTSYLFDMVKRMYSNLPDVLRPRVERSNKIELKFGAIDSEYALGTAGSEEIGRGMSPLLLHCSEAAMYTNTDDLQTGLIQGVPTCSGSEIIYESTASGVNNMFYRLCMKGMESSGDSRLRTLFLAWFWMPEYRAVPPQNFKPSADEEKLMEVYGLDLHQIFWRRRKIEDDFSGNLWKFRQEFPMNALDAFVTTGDMLIAGEFVEAARKLNISPDPLAPKILGVDGADSGDRTALVLRQGKKIIYYKVYTEMKAMTLAGIVASLIDKENIDMVFLDVAYGYGARDRLAELGYGQKTQTVHFGEAALEPEIYKNKRAQMYGYLKEWMEEGGSDIPNEDEFARDLLMIPAFKQTGSRGLLSLPSKLEIRKNNSGISPDLGDAMALTFAFPVMRRNAQARISANQNPVQSIFKTKRRLFGIKSSQEKPSEFFVRSK